jgi:hypothetical protein
MMAPISVVFWRLGGMVPGLLWAAMAAWGGWFWLFVLRRAHDLFLDESGFLIAMKGDKVINIPFERIKDVERVSVARWPIFRVYYIDDGGTRQNVIVVAEWEPNSNSRLPNGHPFEVIIRQRMFTASTPVPMKDTEARPNGEY